MIGYPTFYKNNFRIITGAVNPVFAEDVILLCDTSLGAVNLTLLEIPADRFSTQYKLYIVDQTNNASVNNITITAPIGFTVNNSSVATINVNGGVGVISISSNLTYNAQFNFTGVVGNSIIIENEGVVITPNATTIDFVGSFVNATAVGTNVTVTINPNLIVVNYTQLQTLISTNALIPAQQYLVTDAIFTNTINETVPIIIDAVTTNEVTLSGSGIFLNADYQSVGDYSSVPSVTGLFGVWQTLSLYLIGNIVIWNNLNWVNISGNNGGSPDATPLDWTLLPKTSTTGYITEIDIIKYKVDTNQITYREDVRNNCIENNLQSYVGQESFYYFQWGNDNTTNNEVISESVFIIWNNYGLANFNKLSNISYVEIVTTNQILNSNNFDFSAIIILDNLGVIYNNSFSNIASLQIVNSNVSSVITGNTWKFGKLNNILNFGVILNNVFIAQETFPIDIRNNVVGTNFSNNCIINCKGVIEITTDFLDNNFESSNLQIINNGVHFQNNFFKNLVLAPITNDGVIFRNSFTNIFNSSIINKSTGNLSDNVFVNIKAMGIINYFSFVSNTINNSTFNIVNFSLGNFDDNVINNSTFQCLKNLGIIQINRVDSSSLIDITENQGKIANNGLAESQIIINILDSGSTIQSNQLSSTKWLMPTSTFINAKFISNVHDSSNLEIGSNVTNSFNYNHWIKCTMKLTAGLTTVFVETIATSISVLTTTLLYGIKGGIYQDNCATIVYGLDTNDPAIYNPATFTLFIPGTTQFFIGEYYLENCGFGKQIDKISGLNPNFATKFTVAGAVGNFATFINYNQFALAPITGIVRAIPFPPVVLPAFNSSNIFVNGNIEDFICIRNLGNKNAIEQIYQYI